MFPETADFDSHRQMTKKNKVWMRAAAGLALTAVLAGCGGASEPERPSGERAPAPVNVHPVTHGEIRLIRTFHGSLAAGAEFIVSPKVSGRVEAVTVDISDPVKRGQVVVELDDAEHEQALLQAEAELRVAEANLAQSKRMLEIAQRDMERASRLLERGISSDADFDAAQSELLASEASVEVYEAQLKRAEATVQSAKIRIAYSQVTASWSEGDDERLVAERFVDEGQTVSANTPLLRVVDIRPLKGVFFVTEGDYRRLSPGQLVEIETDAFPGEVFEGMVSRIAPVFERASRQARVELTVSNSELRLRPGMFIRARVELERATEAAIVPDTALVKRKDEIGVFIVSADEKTVRWQPVQVGIRQGNRVQVSGDDLEGEVVTLGQQLIDDGSRISIAGREKEIGKKEIGE